MARSKQEQALCALVETLFAAEMRSEEQWLEIFEALRKILHFSSAVFMPIDPVNWMLQPGYTYDCPNLTAEYLAHYQRLDPYVTAAACLKSCNTPVRFSDIADIARVSQGEFGSFLQQVPYFHALASAPLVQGCPPGVVSVQRRREQPDFNGQEVRLFGWFALQWARAIDYARLRSQFGTPLPYGNCYKLFEISNTYQLSPHGNRRLRRGSPDQCQRNRSAGAGDTAQRSALHPAWSERTSACLVYARPSL